MSAANAGAAKTDKAAALSRSFFIEIPHLRRLRHQPTTWLQFGCFGAKPKAQCRTCDSKDAILPKFPRKAQIGRNPGGLRLKMGRAWLQPVQGSPECDRFVGFTAAFFPGPRTGRKPRRHIRHWGWR